LIRVKIVPELVPILAMTAIPTTAVVAASNRYSVAVTHLRSSRGAREAKHIEPLFVKMHAR
jgi:hypothetical protein